MDMCNNGMDMCNNGMDMCNNGMDICSNGMDMCNNGMDMCNNGMDMCNNGMNMCNNGMNMCNNGMNVWNIMTCLLNVSMILDPFIFYRTFFFTLIYGAILLNCMVFQYHFQCSTIPVNNNQPSKVELDSGFDGSFLLLVHSKFLTCNSLFYSSNGERENELRSL